ncbi:MAG: transposase family protein [Acidobacteriota bacterium]|nr:transposase family protein [Acidobacteriota bacterium]
MRATTAFNRIIAIDGVVVEGVSFTPEGVVVRIRSRKRSHQCPCGFSTKVHYDRSTRRWRHLDLGAAKCFLEAEICRVECPQCQRVDRGRHLGATGCSSHERLLCSSRLAGPANGQDHHHHVAAHLLGGRGQDRRARRG